MNGTSVVNTDAEPEIGEIVISYVTIKLAGLLTISVAFFLGCWYFETRILINCVLCDGVSKIVEGGILTITSLRITATSSGGT